MRIKARMFGDCETQIKICTDIVKKKSFFAGKNNIMALRGTQRLQPPASVSKNLRCIQRLQNFIQ